MASMPWQATVADTVYLGDHLRVHLRLSKQQALIVKVPNNALFKQLRPGQMTGFGWSTDDAHLFELS
jgi:putative spermidine/putrescine transport system ATP-binding protein